MESLQIYWWFLIALLGALLVFLLFVQGGQTMLLFTKDANDRNLIANSLGRKWELTFTTLVVFGGAFFASFPLFYSTSFGGAYWLWMLILLSFILQAVSYEFRRKPGNIFGTRTYDIFLFFNGCVGCILLGVAVGMMFFGADFTITKGNIIDNTQPVISVWGEGHGLEAICSWKNLLFGFTVLMLARMNAALFLNNNIRNGESFIKRSRREAICNGVIFVVLFLGLAALILTSDGYGANADGEIVAEPHKYLTNLLELWWLGVLLLVGVALVLFGLIKVIIKPDFNKAIWFTGTGTVLTVLALLCALGYNNTCYLPSLTSPQSSLSISNSSSTQFTLTVMTWVSIVIPFVLGYIVIVWRKFSNPPLTSKEINHEAESY